MCNQGGQKLNWSSELPKKEGVYLYAYFWDCGCMLTGGMGEVIEEDGELYLYEQTQRDLLNRNYYKKKLSDFYDTLYWCEISPSGAATDYDGDYDEN